MLLITFGGYTCCTTMRRRWPDGYAMLLISLGGYMLYEPTVIYIDETLRTLVAVYILGLQPVLPDKLATVQGRQAITM